MTFGALEKALNFMIFMLFWFWGTAQVQATHQDLVNFMTEWIPNKHSELKSYNYQIEHGG